MSYQFPSFLFFIIEMPYSNNNKRQDDGIDIPNDEGVNNFDDSPYFDYHHLKALENVSQH